MASETLINFKIQIYIWALFGLLFLAICYHGISKYGFYNAYIFTFCFSIGVLWWAWTMFFMYTLIKDRIMEKIIINRLIREIKAVKLESKKLLEDHSKINT